MHFIKSHIEWVTFTAGLILLALMDPTTAGTSFCLFDLAGLSFCPGEGLGHSIAYTFRGDMSAALQAHFMGPIAVIILILRIVHIWQTKIFNYNKKENDG